MDKNKKIIIISAVVAACALALTIALVLMNNQRLEKQDAYFTEGLTLLENGKYKKAVKSFDNALDQALGQLGEKEIDICFYKAQALYLSGKSDDAIKVYTSVIESAENAQAYYLRGNLYYEIGQEGNALKDYESAIKADRDNYDLYVGLYEVLSEKGKTKEAKGYLKEALNIMGNSAYDKMQKGRIQFLLGKEEEAEKLLTEAAKGGEKEAYYHLAMLATSENELKEAKKQIENYMKGKEVNSYSLFNIGNAQLEKGNYDVAIQCLEAAMKLKRVPNRQIVMRTLVVAYEKDLNFEAAKTLLGQYVKNYPSDLDAAREYTFLFTR